MSREIDFSKILFRASQMGKLLVGTIGLTEIQEQEMRCLEIEKATGVNANGRNIKWTDTKKERLEKLKKEFNNPTMPKTMQTELRKIYRAEKYNRNFGFVNKYVIKGITQEEEGITNYQSYRNSNGHRCFLTKNTERLYGEYHQGEHDISPFKLVIEGVDKKIGVDIKCSWELDTFPFPEDVINPDYEAQDDVYMILTDSDMWITASVLVNTTEQLLHNEKMKYFYALDSPNEMSDKPREIANHKEYIEKCRELEKRLIFDYDRFVSIYPYHNLEWSREEWMEAGNDIPLQDRVIEKVVYRNKERERFIVERAKIGRKYLESLQKQDNQKLITL